MTDQDATATAVQVNEANLFDIAGPIHINYTTTSITGTPRLAYKDAELDLNFEDEQITRIQTSLGELITVTLDEEVDAFIRTFTIILPTILVPPGGEIEFDALGIDTIDRTSTFVVASTANAVKHTHRVHQLHGNAQEVAF
jgi:hypothetical protein